TGCHARQFAQESGRSHMAQTVNSPAAPWPVGKVNDQVKGWIEKLGFLWVEGQLTQINIKSTWKLSYLTLRDTEQQKSVHLTGPTALGRHLPTPLTAGARVVGSGKPASYAGRGSFSPWTTDIRHVGIGALLARIEALRKQLTGEGLTDPSRKKPLSCLPKKV